MAKQAVPAIPATPPRYSLLVAAAVVDDAASRWEVGGITWAPEACSGGGVADVTCFGNTAALSVPANEGNVEADPFLVWAGDKCSTIGFEARDYEGRARRLLEATQSARVAHEFWTGDLAASASLDNTPLADATSDTVTTGEVSVRNDGRRGMIHVTPQVLTHAYSWDLITPQGQLWTTALGTIVVADAGYPGTGPNGESAADTQWAYATSMAQVRLSQIVVTPETFNEAVDRSVNTVEYRVGRLALVQWDQCCHFAAEVDIATAAIGGVS
jgi:hypothetical protein